MLEKDFQKQVINFLKEHKIYYIKVWGRRISTFTAFQIYYYV